MGGPCKDATLARQGGTHRLRVERRHRMPRWLWTLLILIFIFAFIIPNPAQTGAWIGNFIDSIIIFFRSIGASVGV